MNFSNTIDLTLKAKRLIHKHPLIGSVCKHKRTETGRNTKWRTPSATATGALTYGQRP